MKVTVSIVLFALAILIVVVYIVYGRRDSCSVLRRIPTHNGTIEIVDADCAEGLPHTTDSDTIRMTEKAYASPRSSTTLVHERVHLDQKRSLSDWYDFYAREWGYTVSKHPPEGLPSSYIANLRPNPDTADAPWAYWKQRWVFFPVYSDAKRTLTNATVVVWDTQTRSVCSIPEQWKAAFCADDSCPHQFEHPHEISAEYIADGGKSPAALKLFNWRS